jgi:hypothetical protein
MVVAVEPGRVEPVFNLEVEAVHSFFVGRRGLLVHDDAPLVPVRRPFDAAPAQAAARRKRRVKATVGRGLLAH